MVIIMYATRINNDENYLHAKHLSYILSREFVIHRVFVAKNSKFTLLCIYIEILCLLLP